MLDARRKDKAQIATMLASSNKVNRRGVEQSLWQTRKRACTANIIRSLIGFGSSGSPGLRPGAASAPQVKNRLETPGPEAPDGNISESPSLCLHFPIFYEVFSF